MRLGINQIAVAPEDAAATISGAQDDVRRALSDVRAIAQGIHPAILDDQGIVRAIGARAKRLPLEVSVEAAPELATRRFDRRIEGAAYFVASEALANIVKHADATVVTSSLLSTTIVSRSASTTMDAASAKTSCAEAGSPTWLTARQHSAAEVTVEANPTGGTTVVAELPLAPTVAA